MSSFKHLSLIAFISLLAACGGSDNKSKDKDPKDKNAGDEHEEAAMQVVLTDNNTNAVSLFHEEDLKFESLGDAAAASGVFVRALNAESAAIKTSAGIQFVATEHHEEEEEGTKSQSSTEDKHEGEEPELLDSLTITDANAKVIAIVGHYSVLKDGNSYFYPYKDLHGATKAEENLTLTGVTQTYPAVILDEEHGLNLVFAADKATVYENSTATTDSWDCAIPKNAVQFNGATLFTCGTDVYSLVVKEEEGKEPEVTREAILSGFSVTGWAAAQGHAVAYNDSGAKIIEKHEDGDVEAEDVKLTLNDATICSVAALTAGETVLTIDSAGFMHFSKGDKEQTPFKMQRVQSSFTCDHLAMSSFANGAVVTDSDAGRIYVLDSDDGAPYHTHYDNALDSGSDIESLAVLHEAGEVEAHDHDHE